MPSGWVDLEGTLEYSPKRLGDHVSPNWWLTAKFNTELGKYFRKLYALSRWNIEKIIRPAWSEHVTIIRNEEPPVERRSLWEKWAGQKMWTRVYLNPQTNGEYWWFECYAPRAMVLRLELGLGVPEIPFHLSFGRTEGNDCC